MSTTSLYLDKTAIQTFNSDTCVGINLYTAIVALPSSGKRRSMSLMYNIIDHIESFNDRLIKNNKILSNLYPLNSLCHMPGSPKAIGSFCILFLRI